MSSLGERLRSAREKSGLKQTQVFEKTKINNKTLSRYENNGSEPDKDTLTLLADLYGVSIDWLYERTDDPKPKNIDLLLKVANEMRESEVIKVQSATHLRAYHGGGDDWTEEEKAAADAFIETLRKRKQEKK